MDYRIEVPSGKKISLMGFRITCDSLGCDVTALQKKYNLSIDDCLFISDYLIDMFYNPSKW